MGHRELHCQPALKPFDSDRKKDLCEIKDEAIKKVLLASFEETRALHSRLNVCESDVRRLEDNNRILRRIANDATAHALDLGKAMDKMRHKASQDFRELSDASEEHSRQLRKAKPEDLQRAIERVQFDQMRIRAAINRMDLYLFDVRCLSVYVLHMYGLSLRAHGRT